jgi:hypothetical protein
MQTITALQPEPISLLALCACFGGGFELYQLPDNSAISLDE